MHLIDKALDTRVADPSRRAFGKLTSPTVLKELIADGSIYEPEDMKNTLVVDTTGIPPEETAETIVKYLQIPSVI